MHTNKLRTRSAQTEFRWAKGHNEENYGNNRANTLADTGREQEQSMRTEMEEWVDRHLALQKGARLQALDVKHTYNELLKWHTKKTPPILHQETLDKVKDKIQESDQTTPYKQKTTERHTCTQNPTTNHRPHEKHAHWKNQM